MLVISPLPHPRAASSNFVTRKSRVWGWGRATMAE